MLCDQTSTYSTWSASGRVAKRESAKGLGCDHNRHAVLGFGISSSPNRVPMHAKLHELRRLSTQMLRETALANGAATLRERLTISLGGSWLVVEFILGLQRPSRFDLEWW